MGVAAIAGAMMWFVVGVLLAAVATSGAYIAQSLYSASGADKSSKYDRAGTATKFVTAGLILASYVAFIIGALCVYIAFKP